MALATRSGASSAADERSAERASYDIVLAKAGTRMLFSDAKAQVEASLAALRRGDGATAA